MKGRTEVKLEENLNCIIQTIRRTIFSLGYDKKLND